MSQALAGLLKDRGMTQTDLWAAAGLSSTVVSRYLSGARGSCPVDRRSATTIEKIARVLEVEPDYFIEYRAWRVQEIARQNPSLADEVYDLLIAYAERENSERGKRPAK